MPAKTDEAAGEAAARAGDRFTVPAHPKLWACEPARWKRDGSRTHWWWLEAPAILFHEDAPTCERCGQKVTWTGPPERRDGLFVYTVICRCLAATTVGEPTRYVVDTIETDWPLRMGGDSGWWRKAWGYDPP